MAGITLKIAQKHLNAWLEAELLVTTNQSYTIGSRSLTRATLRTFGSKSPSGKAGLRRWKTSRNTAGETV